VKCEVFENNTGALEMATVHRIRPRTKHINIKYHHFRSHVDDGSIHIQYVQSNDNVADMFTKGQPIALLQVHRLAILGWDIDDEKGCDNTSYKAGHPSTTGKTDADNLNPTVGGTSNGIGKSGSISGAIVPGNQQSHRIMFSDPTTTKNTLHGAIRK
jgi:hypothetical protein